MRIVDDGKDVVYFKCIGSIVFTNIIMQRDIRGGERSTYFSENSFRFNAVYLHQDKERAVPLNLGDLDLEETEWMCLFLLVRIRFNTQMNGPFPCEQRLRISSPIL